jgi:3-oxoacyl-[acyl-carrier protein] reductase
VCDVSVWAEVSRSRAEIVQVWSGLDALICCAGVQPPIGPAMSLEPLDWSNNIRINLDGTYFPIRAYYDLLRGARARAKVICFSGGGATSPRPNFSAYASAKAGVVRLVENLAHEWKGQPIDINAVAPGAIYTKMTEAIIKAGPQKSGEKEYAQASQQKTKGEAPLEKVGGLVDFLLSAASDGISGKLISAPWDPWADLPQYKKELSESDIYTLRRITPKDRGLKWNEK